MKKGDNVKPYTCFFIIYKHSLAGGGHISYQIRYESAAGKRRKRQQNSLRLPVLISAAFLAFLLSVNFLWPRGGEVLRGVLFPMDETSRQALEVFAQELYQGMDFQDAAQNLCRKLSLEAGLASD